MSSLAIERNPTYHFDFRLKVWSLDKSMMNEAVHSYNQVQVHE